MLSILLTTSEHGFTNSSRMITADLLPSEYDASIKTMSLDNTSSIAFLFLIITGLSSSKPLVENFEIASASNNDFSSCLCLLLSFQWYFEDLEFQWALANNPQLRIESLLMQIHHEQYKLRCVGAQNRFDRVSQSQCLRPKSDPKKGCRLRTCCSHLSSIFLPLLFLKTQLLFEGQHNIFRYNR